MKRCFLLLAAIAAAISTTGCGPKPNTLTAQEKADGAGPNNSRSA